MAKEYIVKWASPARDDVNEILDSLIIELNKNLKLEKYKVTLVDVKR